MKLLITVGTRPEAIKVAPIVRAARAMPGMQVTLCATGQHRELALEALEFFDIQPNYDLAVMQPDQDLASLSSRVLIGVAEVLRKERPDIVLVQGDTVSACMTALAAYYERIPVAHVEAGLRTHDLAAPFPEEGLRQLITRLACLHFAPTTGNSEKLLAEGVPAGSIFITGNTVIDAVLWAGEKLAHVLPGHFAKQWGPAHASIESDRRVILVTGHRRESFGDGLRNVCLALMQVAQKNPGLDIVYPLHPNPNVTIPARQLLRHVKNVHLLGPLDYPAFVYLMRRCYMIISDSGGVQEEAPAFGKPVLVTRVVTERQEGVRSGVAKLVGTDESMIVFETQRLLDSHEYYASFSKRRNPYGQGDAADKIIRVLQSRLKRTELPAESRLAMSAGDGD